MDNTPGVQAFNPFARSAVPSTIPIGLLPTPPPAEPIETTPPVEESQKPKRRRRTAEEIEAAAAAAADPNPPQAAPTPPQAAAPAPNPFAGSTAPPSPTLFPSSVAGNAYAIPGGMPIPGMPDASQLNPFAAPNAELDDDFVIDLSDVQSGGRDFIGVGDHTMYCTKVSSGTSNAGNRKIMLEFTVIAGDYLGKKATSHLALTENAMWKIDQALVALGIVQRDADPNARKPTYAEIKAKAHHVIVIGTFTPDTYNGQATSSFNGLRPPDELGIKTGTTLEQAQKGL